MKMSKFTKIVLLSLIAIMQMLTIYAGFIWFREMFDPNPFGSYILPLILLGLFLTIVLLVDEIRHKPELTTLEACSPPSP